MRATWLASVLLLVSACASQLSIIDGNDPALTESVLRWVFTHPFVQMRNGTRFFVSIDGQDISEKLVARLKDTGVVLLPGSAYRRPHGETNRPETWDDHSGWQITIGKPVLRPDGDYDVNWGDYCGMLCASGNTLVLHHDSSGWHALHNTEHWVS